jgi:branched-chain amino acid transport system substrate-binding protein
MARLTRIAAAAAVALSVTLAVGAAGSASADELKIGYLNSFKHPVGKAQTDGWKLGLEKLGWTKDGDKIAGMPVSVVYCDSQGPQKVDAGLDCARRLIERDKVQILAGVTWSNIMAAIHRLAPRNHVALISTNSGWSGLAGKSCTKYFVSASWHNDIMSEAAGKIASDDGVKKVFILAPNYQAGKDNVAGFTRTYKGGKIIGTILYKVGQTDFQAEITRLRAAAPDAVFIFAPGPMGIAFVKQWAAAGLGKTAKLYTSFTVDNTTLPALGAAALGTIHANFWDPAGKFPANKAFVAGFKAKYGGMPSNYAAQGYDGINLIAAGLKANNGKWPGALAFVKTLRKVKYDSVRGPYVYNVNGMPIQRSYRREVVKGPDGKPMIKVTGVVFERHKDPYWQQCPKKERF